MNLTYDRIIPEEEIKGRILGPDTVGGFSYVYLVMHTDEGKTVVDCAPLSPGETRMRKDDHHQWWVTF